MEEFINWISSLFEKKEVVKNSPFHKMFNIIKHNNAEEIQLIVNKKILHHSLIQINKSSRMVEGEVIKYGSII